MSVPLFPVATPSTRSPEDNIQAISSACHVVEVKDGFALVHASPAGILRITELGLESYHTKRGGEYYAIKVGTPAPREQRPPRLPTPPRLGQGAQGSPLTLRGQDYRVLETRPKRRQDVRRFEVRKEGASECYVVSFQDINGNSAQCSCPDWIYRRQHCKHIRGIQAAAQNGTAAA